MIQGSKAVTASEMLEIEQAWFDCGEITVHQLMERVGKSIADWIIADLDSNPALSNVVILVGKGNNGGDALIAAKHLAASGAYCTACLCLPRDQTDPLFLEATSAGVELCDLTRKPRLNRLSELTRSADVIVDGVFGFSISRPIAEPIKSIFEICGASGAKIVAVDMPSGADPDSGRLDPSALPADVTLSIGLHKLGPAVRFGSDGYGASMELVDYGLPESFNAHIKREVIDRRLAKSLLPDRTRIGHKGTFGQVLIIAGSKNHIGAAGLSTMACLRSGAGLVSLAAPQIVCNAVAVLAPESSYFPLPKTKSGTIDDAAAWRELKDLIAQSDSVLIGPGLGRSDAVRSLLSRMLADKDSWRGCNSVVIDADGLNLCAELPEWWQSFDGNLIITPHPGEMARLLECSIAEIEDDRIYAVEASSDRFGCVTVLKGAVTLISDAEGFTRMNLMPNDGLARGGTGDVLAGLVAGLSNAVSPFDAATLGCYVHALAGVLSRKKKSAYGMTARDVVEMIPYAFSRLAS